MSKFKNSTKSKTIKNNFENLTNILTTPFLISIDVGNDTILKATDFNSLLTLMQELSSVFSFQSNLVGSFSVDNYTRSCEGSRTVQLEALAYIFQTIRQENNLSLFLINSNKYTVVEQSCDQFKIQEVKSTIINAVPICCFID